jgi:hypothetical protein
MSKVICIMGESGSGKTTSLRNLDPKETVIFDCDRKGLSWKGWRTLYNAQAQNYFCTNYPDKVTSGIKWVNDKCPHVKHIVIDTLNGIMVADEMRRTKEKGYDKWVDLAQCVWDLVDGAYNYRDDLTLIFVCHSQTERDDNGYAFTRIKTSGKKLDKIVLESKFTTVLLAKAVDGKHMFETRSNNSTVKTPVGAFEQDTIDNDITLVLKALAEY